MLSKLKEKVKIYENDMVIALVIMLVALIAFGLGRLSVLLGKKTPIRFENASAVLPAGSASAGLNEKTADVAQTNGTSTNPK